MIRRPASVRTPASHDRALARLKASDRKLAGLIEATEPIDLQTWRKARPVEDAFSTLVYSIIGQQIRSAVCAPLVVGDVVRGVLYLDFLATRGAVTPEDVRLIAQIAIG